MKAYGYSVSLVRYRTVAAYLRHHRLVARLVRSSTRRDPSLSTMRGRAIGVKRPASMDAPTSQMWRRVGPPLVPRGVVVREARVLPPCTRTHSTRTHTPYHSPGSPLTRPHTQPHTQSTALTHPTFAPLHPPFYAAAAAPFACHTASPCIANSCKLLKVTHDRAPP